MRLERDELPAEHRDRRQTGMSTVRTSCGVIVGDGERILLGHATRSPRWDIPKGEAGPNEGFAEAAARELQEETGLVVPPSALTTLGVRAYLRGKDLALFAWAPLPLPDPQTLVCASYFALPNGDLLPELDRFGLFLWEDALGRVGRSMARVLAAIPRDGRHGASK